MKKVCFTFFAIVLFLFVSWKNLSGQDIEGGKITYEQIVDYGLEPNGYPGWDNFIADLPKTGKSIFTLFFSNSKALYQEDLSQKEALPINLQRALGKVKYGKPPKPEVQKICYDFNANEKTEQFEFMTRQFTIRSTLENKSWKLTNKKKKVQDYVCMGADLKIGVSTITAWFTPEIPLSAGPGSYYGLPGLILAIEQNEEILILATAIDLGPLKEDVLNQPNKGQKLSQEKFDQIVAEKTEEFEKAKKRPRATARSKG